MGEWKIELNWIECASKYNSCVIQVGVVAFIR
jgi:hypothetical protein